MRRDATEYDARPNQRTAEEASCTSAEPSSTETLAEKVSRSKADYTGCFGCGLGNPIGLQIDDFTVSGSTVTAVFEPRHDYRGLTGVLHGGVVATAMDEIPVWTGILTESVLCVTAKLDLRYRQPAPVDVTYTLEGHLDERRGKRVLISGEAISDDTVVAEASGLFLVSETIGLRRLRDHRPTPSPHRAVFAYDAGMHRSRITILVGTGLAAIALLFPFVSAPIIGGFNGIDGLAWPALVLLSPAVLLALVGDRREGFGTVGTLIALLSASVAVVFAAMKLVDSSLAADAIRLVAGEASVGSGIWVLLVACAIALVGSAMTLSK